MKHDQFESGPGYTLFTGARDFQTDTYHDSLIEALGQADSEWTGLRGKWAPIHADSNVRRIIAGQGGGARGE